ncbi:hypothetical protein ABFX02_02G114600 [Erythranthe guttata]
MRLVTGNPGVVECSCGAAGDDGGGAAVVVVAVKMDSPSRELLTWALVKVAQSGDRVIALHILDPDADKLTLLSLVKAFDSVLAAYESFCNLKQAKHILKEGKISELQDPKLVNACNHKEYEIMVLAATLCIRTAPQSRPQISLVSKLLQGDQEVVDWARQETKSCEEINVISNEQSATNMQSFINLAFLDLEDDSDSISSSEQNISVEDYLGGRWSRSSSFD